MDRNSSHVVLLWHGSHQEMTHCTNEQCLDLIQGAKKIFPVAGCDYIVLAQRLLSVATKFHVKEFTSAIRQDLFSHGSLVSS